MKKLKQIVVRQMAALRGKILREKASPEYIARGWALGMFCGCLIPFGAQLAISIPCSFLIKGSKIGATVGTLITNHFTIFIIYPVQCYVGNRLLGGDLNLRTLIEKFKEVDSFKTLFALGGEVAGAFFVGGALLTAIMTPLTYFFVLSLVKRHRARRERKLAKKAARAQ